MVSLSVFFPALPCPALPPVMPRTHQLRWRDRLTVAAELGPMGRTSPADTAGPREALLLGPLSSGPRLASEAVFLLGEES